MPSRLPFSRLTPVVALWAAAAACDRTMAQAPVITPHAILFVTQVPVPTDFTTIGSTFGNHRGGVRSAARGGDLWIRYPDGTLRNLTALAGYGNSGFQGAGSIAVRDPAVHWDGTRAVFAMVQGSPPQQYQTEDYYWQLYEVTGLGPSDTPLITPVSNQPSDYNNVNPCYGSDDRILFASDRPRDGSPHLYPQLDEYECAQATSGIWSLDPVSGDLRLLNHAPSSDFTPIVDSFGRVLFTQWDHLQRDQLADIDFVNPTYGMFNWSHEGPASVPTSSVAEVFPEPRPSRVDLLAGTNLRGHLLNHFFPWQMHQDGSGIETINHVGRHELHSYFNHSINGDPNVHEFIANSSVRPSLHNCFHLAEDPLQAGRYIGIDAPEFGSHSSGQIIELYAPPSRNPDLIEAVHLTHPDTFTQTSAPSAEHSGHYRDPLPLSDGTLIAAHASYTDSAANIGTLTAPQSPYAFRLRTLAQTGSYLASDQELTGSIHKSVSWWNPDHLITYSGPLWELNPVEVRARTVPLLTTEANSQPLQAPEQAAFTAAGVDPAVLRQFLHDRQLALITSRNVTTRDHADQQQPFNLRITGTTTETLGAPGTVYDVSYLQIFQGDMLRGMGGPATPTPGRRVLAQPLHDPQATALLPATPNGPVGSTALGADGSMAAFVPATRALSWQLTDAAGEAIVRERYWLTFQPGEIRVCASCHGTNSSDQASQPEPSNTPQALVDLLRHWQASTGPVLPAVAAGSVGGAAAPENVLTINGSHGGFGRRVDLLPGQPSLLQINSPAAGPASSLFALWAYIGVPTPAEQLPTFAGTLMFPLPQMMPGNPLLLTVSNSLFADPGAILPAAATPWVLPLPGLPPQFTVTMQGAVYDSSSPFALSVTNALILRVP